MWRCSAFCALPVWRTRHRDTFLSSREIISREGGMAAKTHGGCLVRRIARIDFRRIVLIVSIAACGQAVGQSAGEAPATQSSAPLTTPVSSKNLAPGFASLHKGLKVVIMPTDIELFSISAGGVLEPKADWTEAASRNFKEALLQKKRTLGLETAELTESQADDVAEINTLHGAVAQAISLHHFGISAFSLPTKDGKLDWSLGEAVRAVKDKTGADYALFSWIRDSYASGERKAAMVVMAVLGIGLTGGAQIGYASLVDLNTGQVLWFNKLVRASGDLREAEPAAETLDALLAQFPVSK
jgi:hypothetical protein